MKQVNHSIIAYSILEYDIKTITVLGLNNKTQVFTGISKIIVICNS